MLPLKRMKSSEAPRTYDPDGFRRRAACLCFRDLKETEVLLITSTASPSKWIVPGGGVDPGEEPGPAAAREAWEEAGVRGAIDRLLGVFENNEKKTRTWVFAMQVQSLQDEWLESEQFDRQRRWFTLIDVKEKLAVNNPALLNYINLINNNKG